MKKMILLLCTCLLILVTTAAHSTTIQVYGLGMDSCGKLVQAFRENSPDRALNYEGHVYRNMAGTYQEWLLGYIDAYNILVTSENMNDKTINSEATGLMEWVHSYCQQNPTAQVLDAALALIYNVGQYQTVYQRTHKK